MAESKIHIKEAKGNKERIVMLPYSIINYLDNYKQWYKGIDWVFEGQYKGEAYSSGSVQIVMKNAVKKVGAGQESDCAYTLPQFCHPLVGSRHRYTLHTGFIRA